MKRRPDKIERSMKVKSGRRGRVTQTSGLFLCSPSYLKQTGSVSSWPHRHKNIQSQHHKDKIWYMQKYTWTSQSCVICSSCECYPYDYNYDPLHTNLKENELVPVPTDFFNAVVIWELYFPSFVLWIKMNKSINELPEWYRGMHGKKATSVYLLDDIC